MDEHTVSTTCNLYDIFDGYPGW